MKAKNTIAALLLSFSSLGSFAQAPLVYNAENTGASCAAPPLPTFSQLPIIEPLPDPFMWANGSGRSTNFSDWECRRNEIRAEIENYEIGTKPTRPQNITASYAAGVLTVNVTVNGQTLTLTSQVSLPTGSGPFPAIIGMNSPSGSVPASVFTGRSIARITFNHNQVTTYGNPQNTDPYYRLYPNLNIDNTGQYSAWAWGVSRIIDGLELVQASLPIDLRHVGVTGCSYAGKMALYCGAFDERVALTIAQESGGGGAPAWRVSETLGGVEKLGNTDYNWFKEDLRQFAGLPNASKLPYDHHELMAMIAPRALLVTGNTDVTWLANPSAYVSARAAHEVWKTFGVGDRFGFYIDGGHGHCAVPAAEVPVFQAFVDKFLVGNTSVNTTMTINPYPLLDYQRWYQWWGTGNPTLPAEPLGKRIWLEAECANVGSDWQTVADTAAAHNSYVVVNGLNSTSTAPGATGTVVFPFTVDSAATYNFVARVFCPTANDDSYWVKVDNGAYVTINGITTSTWEWAKLTDAVLSVGPHTFTIGYREDGAKLDKILITTSGGAITGKGGANDNCKTAQTIGFPAIPAKIYGDADFTLSATASSGLPITYLSSDPTVATVTNGLVHMLKGGSTTITALQVGNATYQSAAANQVLTVAPVQVSVLYQNGDAQPSDNAIRPNIQLVNTGTAAISYQGLTVRYWFTPETMGAVVGDITWADKMDASQVKVNYTALAPTLQGAYGYVEYSFLPGAGSLAAGTNSGAISSSLHQASWGNFEETNDYSYATNTSFAANSHIALYRNGVLIAGTEPSAPVVANYAFKAFAENRNAAMTTNGIQLGLQVNNLSNVPVAYSDLSVRYWFSPDGTSPVSPVVTYAPIGANNMTVSTGQKGAEMYLEMHFAPALGQLAPLANTGEALVQANKADWSNFSQANDYSFQPAGPLAENSHVTVYYQGQLVYGTEPGTATVAARGTGASPAPTTSAASQNTLEAYPNPVASEATVQFRTAQAGHALVQVYSSLGQLVTTLYDGSVEEGRAYQLPFAAQSLANGLYQCRLVLDGKTMTQRLVVSH